jgi:ribosomal protein L14E/L6E/L27E
MNDYQVGQIAKSRAGRDKANLFVIIDKDTEYVYLVDGKIRKVDNPKKKKFKHIEATNYIDSNIVYKINDDQKIVNADIRKAIQFFETEAN